MEQQNDEMFRDGWLGRWVDIGHLGEYGLDFESIMIPAERVVL